MSAGSKGDLTKDIERVYTTHAYMSKQRPGWLRVSARGRLGRVSSSSRRDGAFMPALNSSRRKCGGGAGGSVGSLGVEP